MILGVDWDGDEQARENPELISIPRGMSHTQHQLKNKQPAHALDLNKQSESVRVIQSLISSA